MAYAVATSTRRQGKGACTHKKCRHTTPANLLSNEVSTVLHVLCNTATQSENGLMMWKDQRTGSSSLASTDEPKTKGLV